MSNPDLVFTVAGIPPRKTLQSGRGAYADGWGGVRFFTKAGVWEDDAQVFWLTVRKWRGRRPRWQVAVWFEAAEPSPAVSAQGSLPGMGERET